VDTALEQRWQLGFTTLYRPVVATQAASMPVGGRAPKVIIRAQLAALIVP